VRRRLWSAIACGLALATGLFTCLAQSMNFHNATGLDRDGEEIDRLRAVNAELTERVLRRRTRALLEDLREADNERDGADLALRGVQ
jgi:hypothetical protein